MTALEEAGQFLYRHPHFTSDVDDPIELLRQLHAEAADGGQDEEIEDLKGALDRAESEIVELKADLAQARRELATARKELAAAGGATGAEVVTSVCADKPKRKTRARGQVK